MDGFFSSSMGTTISFMLEYLADCYAEKRGALQRYQWPASHMWRVEFSVSIGDCG